MPPCASKPSIASGTDAGIRLPHDIDAVAEAAENFGRIVRGPVVDDDDLCRTIDLAQNALHRLHDEMRAVVGRNDHAEGCRQHVTSPAR